MGKFIADLAPIDEWLFDASFVEKVEDAQVCEKVASTRQSSRCGLQDHLSMQRKSNHCRGKPLAGNVKALARQLNQPYVEQEPDIHQGTDLEDQCPVLALIVVKFGKNRKPTYFLHS